MISKPDFSKTKYKIVISVHENCSSFEIVSKEKDTEIHYHELIGVLEIQKTMLIHDQSDFNRTVYEKEIEK